MWDPAREILPSDNFAAAMGKALAESDALVVLFTPNSVESEFIQGEFAYSLGDRRFKNRVIPVLAGIDSDRLPWIARTFQWVDLDRVGANGAASAIASALSQPV